MNINELQLQAIELNLQRQTLALEQMKKTIVQAALYQNIPAFCTLEQAANLKGGTTAKNLQKRKWQQPGCGTRWTRYNGNRVWARDEIIRWLSVTDDTLEEYAASCGVDISRWFKNGKTIQETK